MSARPPLPRRAPLRPGALLREVGPRVRLWARLVGAQARSQAGYRASFATDLLGTAVVAVVEFAALALALPRFGTLGGWTLPQVAFLYGSAELAFGTMDLLFGGFDPPRFGREIRTGGLDRMLVRPAPVALQVLGSELALRRFGKIAVGAAVLGWSLATLDVAWTPAKLAFLPLMLAGMVMFFGGLFVIGAAVTVRTVDGIEAMNMLTYGGAYLISHPMHIYGAWLRRVFTFVVPAIFLNWLPALWILGLPDPLGFPLWTRFLSPLVGLAVLLASGLLWRAALRAYASSGT